MDYGRKAGGERVARRKERKTGLRIAIVERRTEVAGRMPAGSYRDFDLNLHK